MSKTVLNIIPKTIITSQIIVLENISALLLLLCSGFFLQACTGGNSTRKTPKVSIDSIKHIVLNGDMILRNGTDEVSTAARNFGRKEKIYSHCGIIQIENDTAWVYHAIGGKYNPSNQLKKELLSSFCDNKENDKIAIYRYVLSKEEIKKLNIIVDQYFAKKLPFDLFFNFNTDNAMYCAEFVFKSYNRAMHNRLASTLIKDNEGRTYVTVDDLYLNTFCKPVFTGNL